MIILSRVTVRNNKQAKRASQTVLCTNGLSQSQGYLQPLFYAEDILIILLALIKGIRSCKVLLQWLIIVQSNQSH